jgi:hypothetical protein
LTRIFAPIFEHVATEQHELDALMSASLVRLNVSDWHSAGDHCACS